MSYELKLPLHKNIANAANYGAKRALSSILWIVVHYTGNDGDTDEGNGKYFGREAVGASAHYFVDEDSATQSVPDDYIAWHCQTPGMTLKCGCRNSNSIGVEMCSDVNKAGKYIITEATKCNTAELVKWLMDKYGIPPERVIRHYDVCGKNCPEPWVRDAKEWADFKSLIVTKEDEEMVETINIVVNGKEIKADAIVKDGMTFIKLGALENAGFEVGFDGKTKLRKLDNEIKKLPVVVDGTETDVKAVNLYGYNYVPVRSMAAALGAEVGYRDKKVILETNR